MCEHLFSQWRRTYTKFPNEDKCAALLVFSPGEKLAVQLLPAPYSPFLCDVFIKLQKERCVCHHLWPEWTPEIWGFPGGTVVKNSPVMQETQEMWIWTLGQKDLLEKEMATHPSSLACPWAEEPGGLSLCSCRVGHGWALHSTVEIWCKKMEEDWSWLVCGLT